VLGRAIVGDRLDLSVVDVKCGSDQTLAVSRGAGTGQHCRAGQCPADPADDLRRCSDRVATVGLVVGPDDAPLVVDEHRLDRRRAGVDAEEARPARPGGLHARDSRPRVPCVELRPRLVVCEEGWQARTGVSVRTTITRARREFGEVNRVTGGQQRGAVRNGELRVGRDDERAHSVSQRPRERCPELR